ncbi:MAG: branched-chain amino acid ABC transporter permease [Alphaproteobacteria bacterium]|nr:branched-chain amino acid ABC transporter permease [Alphaproteobacteria bacterium]
MLETFLQFLFSGITTGAIYALVALGFTLIYNASHVINFAQGEFVMIGGMATVFLVDAGWPIWAAAPLAVLLAIGAGVALERIAIAPAREASTVALIVITIGASILLRGLAQLVWDRNFHTLAPFSDEAPIRVLGASILPQSLWVLGGSLLAVLALGWFFGRTLLGKAVIATAHNRLAAELMGIETRRVMTLCFALSALLGALGGVLITPITLTSYDAGVMLGLKGFSAAILGGMGSAIGAVLGGLLLGVVEAMGAGFLSSAYKDAIAFVLILVVLIAVPRGLMGARDAERV